MNLTHLSDPPCSLLPILAPGVLSFQGHCLTIKQTSTNAPFVKWGLFSHEFSKVHSAKLGHERALGGKSDNLSPVDVPKAGFCPWNPLQMIIARPCPKKIFCSSDSQCSGDMKCCNVGCTMTCTTPVPGMQFQDPGPPLLPSGSGPHLTLHQIQEIQCETSPGLGPRVGGECPSQSCKPVGTFCGHSLWK